jgi:hypothetical protein
MFKRVKRIKEIVEIQIFSLIIAAAVIVKEKTHRKRKYENPPE